MEFTRRRFLKTSGLGFAVLAGTGLLGGCGNDGAKEEKTDEVIVAMTTGSEPEAGFDPFYSWGCGEHVHEPLIQSTLITTNADLEFVNDLATGYKCSEDGLSWTFDLRDDVKFSDGTPLTARDVAFTINGIKNFEGAELDLSYVKEAVAKSDTRVVIKLNKPFNALLYTLAVVGIVPEAGYDSATYGSAPIGSGRYMLEQWDKGQQAIFTANPDYYGDAPTMKRVVVLFMEEDAALAAAQSGEVDVAYTAATLADQVPSGYELSSYASVDSRGISLPTGQPTTRLEGGVEYQAGNAVTSHVELRQAINLALDRKTLVDNVLGGHGSVAYSVCDSLPWASKDMEVETDLDAAAELMASGGWSKGEDGVYVLDGYRASFELYYPTDDSVRQACATEFANQMADFGIEVKCVGSSWTEDADGLYAHQYSDPLLWGWGANSPTQLYDLIYSSSQGNYAGYASDAVDKHIDAALAKPDVADSYEQWAKAQWDGEDGVAPQGAASWVWLANVDHLYFVREGLHIAKQKPHPHGHGWSLVNNVDKWSW